MDPASPVSPEPPVARSRGRWVKGVSGNAKGREPRVDAVAASADPEAYRLPVTDPRVDVGTLMGTPQVLERRAALLPRGRAGRLDDWRNPITGQGIPGRDKRLGGFFAPIALSFDQLKDLWGGDDLAAVAVEMLPKEAARPGWDLTISDTQEDDGDEPDSDLATDIKDKCDDLGVDEKTQVVGNYARAYGGGVLLLGVNDKSTDLTKPLDWNNIVSLDWLTALEARECIPIRAYGNPMAPKYGEPEIYQITSRTVLPSSSAAYGAATMPIHESRLIAFDGIRVSRYQSTAARAGWGESVLTRVWRVLRDFNSAYSSAGVLVNDFSQTVIKIKGLFTALAGDNGDLLADRFAAMDLGRSVTNSLTIDSEDDFQRQTATLTGLSDLLERFAVRLAAACGMPLTLLFGTSPAGMNATGESDIRFFYDRVDEYRKKVLRHAIRKIVKILFLTMGTKREPKKWHIEFRPLWQESAKDLAGAMATQAQAEASWISSQVLSPEECAKAHWSSGKYNPNLNIDLAARERGEAVTKGPVTMADLQAMGRAPAPEAPVGGAAVPPAPNPKDPKDPKDPEDPEDPEDPKNPKDPKDPKGPKDPKDPSAREDDWDEGAHPRASDGKFGEGGGGGAESKGGSGAKGKTASVEKLQTAATKASNAAARASSDPLAARAAHQAAAEAHRAVAAHPKASEASVKAATAEAARHSKFAGDAPAASAPKVAVAPKAPAVSAPKAPAASASKAAAASAASTSKATAQAAKVQAVVVDDPNRAKIVAPTVPSTNQYIKAPQWTPQTQAAIRDHHDRVLATYGTHANDTSRSVTLIDGLKVGDAQVYGSHGAAGDVALWDRVGQHLVEHAALSGKELSGLGQRALSGDKHAMRMMDAYRVSTHEALHGHGVRMVLNTKYGTMHDEVTTELTARQVSADVHGLQAHQVPGSYDRYIVPMVRAVADVSGKSHVEVHAAMTKASIEAKSQRPTHPSDETYGDDEIKVLASSTLKELGVTSETSAEKVLERWDHVDRNQAAYAKEFPSENRYL